MRVLPNSAWSGVEGAIVCWPWNLWSGLHSWKTLLFLYLLVLGTTSYSLLILGYSGRAAAFLAAPKNCYFRWVCTFCLCPTCTACEMLKNAPLDAAISFDTAENRLFRVQVKEVSKYFSLCARPPTLDFFCSIHLQNDVLHPKRSFFRRERAKLRRRYVILWLLSFWYTFKMMLSSPIIACFLIVNAVNYREIDGFSLILKFENDQAMWTENVGVFPRPLIVAARFCPIFKCWVR